MKKKVNVITRRANGFKCLRSFRIFLIQYKIAKCQLLLASKAQAKREKQNKNLKFLIRFLLFPHLFPSCFLTNEKTLEKLANVFRSDQNIFVEKKHFLFDFIVSPSVFPRLQDIWFKHMAKRIELTKTNKKCTQNLKRYHVN